MAKIVKCKTCNEEIAANAKACPHCGAKNKKPFYKAVWFWIIVAAVIIIAISVGSGSKKSDEQIEYASVTVDTLESARENNAASAKETYKDQYVAITGRVGSIDSDLSYISILSTTDEWDIIGIHCTLKDQTAKDVVKTLVSDQTVIVKGKITEVGEVLGYYLDVDEIVPQ